MLSVQTLFLDLGNVVVTLHKDRAMREITRRTGLVMEISNRAAESPLEKSYEIGQISTTKYLETLRHQYPETGQLGLVDWQQIWGLAFELNPAIWLLIPRLRTQLQVFLLSNTNALHILAIEKKWKLREQFDGLILSYEVGAAKPQRRIYEIALNQAKTQASQALFADDLPENIAGAEAVGIHCHRYRDQHQFEIFLQSAGLQL
jgi:putative hydrolase of the HAD superfamily